MFSLNEFIYYEYTIYYKYNDNLWTRFDFVFKDTVTDFEQIHFIKIEIILERNAALGPNAYPD